MTDETTAPEADIQDNVDRDVKAENVQSDDKAQDRTVPYGSLHEERQKRKAAEEQLEAMASQVLAQVPEDMRGLIPESLPPMERVAWFNSAKATGIFDKTAKPSVPKTDSGQPRISPPPADLNKLPSSERMKLGYGRRKG